MANAPDCGSGDRGFESHYPPFFISFESMRFIPAISFKLLCDALGYRQAVRHSTLTAALVGSNPASPVFNYEILAQLVEHLTFNQVVVGSIPTCLISNLQIQRPAFGDFFITFVTILGVNGDQVNIM